MKKVLGVWLILLLIVVGASAQEEFPKPIGYVNDFANVIPDDAERELEALILEVKQKTGAEIAVVTIPTVGDRYTVPEYANLLFEKWGIGEKGKDNGLLILDSVNDRYIWIEVGYGLEGILPDGLVGEIRDKYFIPFLKKGDYASAFLTGVRALAGVIAENAGVTIDGTIHVERRPAKKPNGFGWGDLFWLLFLFFILPALFGRRRRRGSMFWGPWFWGGFGGGFGGGGFGGGGGGFGGFGGGASGGGGAGGSY